MDFEQYFNNEDMEENLPKVDDIHRTKIKYEQEQENEIINTYMIRQIEELQSCGKLTTGDIISDIDVLGKTLEDILKKAWSSNWGNFGPDLVNKEQNPNELMLPQITYDYLLRRVPQKFPRKPKLYSTMKEVINGKETGDAFKVYRQWFDYVLEFQIWHENSLKARSLMKNFEAIFNQSTAYLKHHGVMNVEFLEEGDPRNSSKYRHDIPMRSLSYMIRLENIEVVRVSTLDTIRIATQRV